MQYFEIEGGHQLNGEIVPQGAKNEALQVVCAVLLSEEKVTLTNVPDILDVNRLISLLEFIGVEIKKNKAGSFTFRAKNIDIAKLKSPEFFSRASRLRGSVMIMGPLLARFGQAFMPRPGGDKIGRRRMDTHFLGFQNLGAHFIYEDKERYYKVFSHGRLKGTFMHLDEPSVTGTANIVMAAVLADGVTTIYNAACEPYLQQLCKLLNSMGAKIEEKTIGSNKLIITGVEALGAAKKPHRILSDMIEIGSFIGMAAMTQSQLTIKNADIEYLGIIPNVFRRLGVEVEAVGNDLVVHRQHICKIDTYIEGGTMTIYDHPWPGFTPDLMSILLVVATQCEGSVLIHQKMFESRLFFVDKLIDMGARVILSDPHRAVVIGLGRQHMLRGITMSSPDIRAGIALLIAAMSANGTSRIFNIEQIDRGYQDIEKRLNALGASIKRLDQ
ncbi:MAG TPA: UDP-N-acetylglucosamine 1-carboxyvinyltransferase [Bacteroidetes bacterium]|nr:UDP-N-acetylglucosamine 1-carboxyvinyltransferase [Bacteroidota bacterium]